MVCSSVKTTMSPDDSDTFTNVDDENLTPYTPLLEDFLDTTSPPGFHSYPVQNAPYPLKNYGSIDIVSPPLANGPIQKGVCLACRTGVKEDVYPWFAICLAIGAFPVGILCCLALKESRCKNCGSYSNTEKK